MSSRASQAALSFKRQGEASYQAKEYRAAAEAFSASAGAFEAVGQPQMAAEMANNASVAYLQAGQLDLAYRAVTDTPQLFAGSGDLERASLAFGNRANVLEAMGELDKAEDDYRRALEGFEQLADQTRIRETRQALSALRLRQGRPMEALTEMQIGLEGQARRGLRDRIIRWILRLPSRLLPR